MAMLLERRCLDDQMDQSYPIGLLLLECVTGCNVNWFIFTVVSTFKSLRKDTGSIPAYLVD